MSEGKTAVLQTVVRSDGSLLLPAEEVRQFGLRPGQPVIVRLTLAELDGILRRRGVTDEEIEQIATAQLEDRHNVALFLMSEGALSQARSFRGRVKRLRV